MASLEDAIARTLRQMRESRGLTKSEVAVLADTKEATLGRWEKTGAAGRTPTPTSLAKLANVYETTPSALYASAEKDAVGEKARKVEQKIKGKHGNGNKD